MTKYSRVLYSNPNIDYEVYESESAMSSSFTFSMLNAVNCVKFALHGNFCIDDGIN